jgi:guanylate kinase
MNSLLTITGPSCSGKTTLLQLLCEKYNFSQILSTMTRQPRPGEEEGVHGYFVSHDKFFELVETGQMAQHVRFSGNMYGSTWAEVKRITELGRTPCVIVEPSGVFQYGRISKTLGLRQVRAYLSAPLEVLIDRYSSRLVGRVIESAEMEYHAGRLTSLVGEHADWPHDARYDHTFDNCGTVEGLEQIALNINNLITQLEEDGKSRASKES